MCRFFTIITCTVIIAGSVGGNGIVKVERGEDFSLSFRTSEPKTVSLQKVVQKNETQEIFLYCSPEEQNHGCKPNNSSRFSHHIGKENFSVTFLDASTSDEGRYIVEVIDDKNKRIQHNYSVSLTEQMPRSINPEPPSTHPFSTPALSTKGEETFGTNGPITTVSTEGNRKITGGIIGGIIGGLLLLILAIVVTGIICFKKKKQYVIVDDDTEGPEKGSNGAGEPATVESFEILVLSDRLVDNNNEPVHGA